MVGAVGLSRQTANTVTLSYRKGSLFKVKKKNEDAITRLIAEHKLTVLFDSQVVEICPTSVRLQTPVGIIEIPNDSVIVQIGGIPPYGMLRDMGIAFGGEMRPLE